ncbi:MAG: SDR family NAD(P)-dependent oxidoreductase [Bacteroidota bacterium]
MGNRKDKWKRRDIIKASALSVAGLSLAGFTTDKKYAEKELKPLPQFKGNVAFITGGARGIGFSIAETLAEQGANIVIYDIAQDIDNVPYALSNLENLSAAKEKIESFGVQCLAIQGDVRNFDEQKKAINETVRAFGRLDFLIANAGVTRFGNLESHSDEMMKVLMDINIGGVAKTIKAASPILITQKSGRIITLSSVTGRGGVGYFPVYAASKWGVIGLTKSMAIELGSHNINCNVVCPTVIDTKMAINEHMLQAWGTENLEDRSGIDGFLKSMHTLPIGILSPKAIASAVSFLCSDASKNISGTVLDVSAGWTAGNNA